MKKSFYSMVSHLEGLPHVGMRLTMKNGSCVDIGEFKLRGNIVLGKNGNKASLLDVDYIEIDSE